MFILRQNFVLDSNIYNGMYNFKLTLIFHYNIIIVIYVFVKKIKIKIKIT